MSYLTRGPVAAMGIGSKTGADRLRQPDTFMTVSCNEVPA